MDLGQETRAHDVVNGYPEEKLADVIRRFGEERNARAIAREIVRERENGPIDDTLRFAEIVSRRVPDRWKTKTLSRVFQSIRMEVNAELESLGEALDQAVEILAAGGCLAVISYHSLEDRIVKRRFQEWARGCVCPPYLPVCRCGRAPVLNLSPRRAIRPAANEVAANPRARSARLRVGVRIDPGGEEKREVRP